MRSESSSIAVRAESTSGIPHISSVSDAGSDGLPQLCLGFDFERDDHGRFVHFVDRNDIANAEQAISLEISRLISGLQSTRAALLRQSNTMCVSGSLPFEILAAIFAYCSSGPGEFLSRKAWIGYTHVSSHWRSTALNTPSLWTRFELGHRDMMGTVISRSHPLPLSLRARVDKAEHTANMARAVRFAMEHARRIHELELVTPTTGSTAMFAELSSPAPSLHTLKVTGLLDNYNGQGEFLKDDVFGGSAFQPRNMELLRVSISWKANWMTSLTRLHISRPTHRIHIWEPVFSGLAKMPFLEDLYLDNALPDKYDLDHPPEPVPLPRVCTIAVKDSAISVAHFIRHISLPPRARPKFDFVFVTSRSNQKEAMLLSLRKYAESKGWSVGDSAFDTLSISGNDRLSIQLHSSLDSDDYAPEAPFLHIGVSGAIRVLPELLACFPRAGWTEKVHLLDLSGTEGYRNETLGAAAPFLKDIRIIRAAGEIAKSLIVFLATGAQVSDVAPFVFPALQSLTLRDVKLEDCTISTPVRRQPRSTTGLSYRELLVAALSNRRGLGGTLAELRLERCLLTPGGVKELSGQINELFETD